MAVDPTLFNIFVIILDRIVSPPTTPSHMWDMAKVASIFSSPLAEVIYFFPLPQLYSGNMVIQHGAPLPDIWFPQSIAILFKRIIPLFYNGFGRYEQSLASVFRFGSLCQVMCLLEDSLIAKVLLVLDLPAVLVREVSRTFGVSLHVLFKSFQFFKTWCTYTEEIHSICHHIHKLGDLKRQKCIVIQEECFFAC